jgi:hypothetical protein
VTVRLDIRAAVGAALKGKTSAGNEVYLARDWPIETDNLTQGIILVFAMKERKERVRSGGLFYTTTATLDVMARIARSGPETALKLMDAMVEQIAAAVITSTAIYQITQYAPNVDIEIGMNSQAELQFAQALITFSFEYPERYQLGGVPLKSIQANEGGFGSFEALLPQ